jgi:hypothetical protein
MAVAVYATTEELEDYLGEAAPADATRLLKRASAFIATFATAGFVADVDGLPTDEQPLAGLRDAVCAQIEFWIETGDEKEALAYFESVSTSGFSAKRSGVRLAPRARDALIAAGLTQGVAAW